jgi:hypothetical protein
MQSQNITLTLSAHQADTLADAVKTFAPRITIAIAFWVASSYTATVPVDELAAVRMAVQSYGEIITPGSRTTSAVLKRLNKAAALLPPPDVREVSAAVASLPRTETRAIVSIMALLPECVDKLDPEERAEHAAIVLAWCDDDPEQDHPYIVRLRARAMAAIKRSSEAKHGRPAPYIATTTEAGQ